MGHFSVATSPAACVSLAPTGPFLPVRQCINGNSSVLVGELVSAGRVLEVFALVAAFVWLFKPWDVEWR